MRRLQAMLGSSSVPTFLYEVTGLRQNDQTDNNSYQIRQQSGSVMIRVPLNRMNEEMHCISHMGGTIVAIHSSAGSKKAETSQAAPAEAS